MQFKLLPRRECSLWCERQNQDGVAKLCKMSLALTFLQQLRQFRPQFGHVVLYFGLGPLIQI